jgi:hypothetical protein
LVAVPDKGLSVVIPEDQGVGDVAEEGSVPFIVRRGVLLHVQAGDLVAGEHDKIGRLF